MPDFNAIVIVLLIAVFFAPIASAAIGILHDSAADRRLEPCNQHIWSTNNAGYYICVVCKKSPNEDVASKEDFEIDE